MVARVNYFCCCRRVIKCGDKTCFWSARRPRTGCEHDSWMFISGNELAKQVIITSQSWVNNTKSGARATHFPHHATVKKCGNNRNLRIHHKVLNYESKGENQKSGKHPMKWCVLVKVGIFYLRMAIKLEEPSLNLSDLLVSSAYFQIPSSNLITN